MSLSPRRPVLLVILDGIAVNPNRSNNGFALAETPMLDHLFAHHPHTVIEASGRACGLPDGQMGNSEVGHLTLGSGQTIRQDLVAIDDAVADGTLFENPALTAAARRAAASGRAVHLIGLVSDGGVHSHVEHLLALIELCRRAGATPLLHFIADGRDTAPKSSLSWLDRVEQALTEAQGRIVTVSGRYWAMDRDKRWERTERAFRVIALGQSETGGHFSSAREAIASRHAADETDEFLMPMQIGEPAPLRSGDEVLFFNFRNDRPRQLTEALIDADFPHFERPGFHPAHVTTLTEYDPRYQLPVAFQKEKPTVTLAGHLAQLGLNQFHCAETEKYAHVTFFFNGQRESPFPGEDRAMVPSPKVATYDLKPEMSAPEVADTVIAALESGKYPFVLVNFANGDMVGHTAVREAILKAVNAVDAACGRLVAAAEAAGYSVLVTADHGNCDEMIDPVTGEPHTQHTVYPVPCLLIDPEFKRLTTGGGIVNVAGTVLELMGLPRPAGMAKSLLLHAH